MKVLAATLGARESLASTTTASSSLSSTIKNPLALFTLPPMMTMPEPVAPKLHHTDTVSGVPSSTAATTSSQQPSQQSSLCAVDKSGATPTSASYPIDTYEVPYVVGAGAEAGASTTSYISATVSTDPNGLSFLLTTYSSNGAVYTSNLGIIIPSTASTATTASGQNAPQTSNANAPTSTFTSAVTGTSLVMMTESTTKMVTLDSQHPTPAAVTVSQPSHGSTSAPSSYVTPAAEPQPRYAMNAFKSKQFAERRDLLWTAARGKKVQARQEELWEPDEVENAEPAGSQQDTETDSQEKREAKGSFRAGGRGGGGCAGCSSAPNRISTPRMSSLLALFVVMLATLMILPGIGAAPVEAGHATTGFDPVSEVPSVVAEVVDLTAYANDTVPVQKWECDHGGSFPHYDGCGNAAPRIRKGPSTLAIVLAVLACLVVLPMAAAAPVELDVDADTRAVNATAPSTSTLVSDTTLYFAAPTAYTPSKPATPILELRAEAVEADDPGPTCVHDGHAIYSITVLTAPPQPVSSGPCFPQRRSPHPSSGFPAR
jgi:hypothetical protein